LGEEQHHQAAGEAEIVRNSVIMRNFRHFR